MAFSSRRKKTKTCSGSPDQGWEWNAFVSIPNPGSESGKLFVLAECRIPSDRGSSAFRTGTVSTHFFSKIIRKNYRPFGAVGLLFDSTIRFTIWFQTLTVQKFQLNINQNESSWLINLHDKRRSDETDRHTWASPLDGAFTEIQLLQFTMLLFDTDVSINRRQ